MKFNVKATFKVTGHDYTLSHNLDDYTLSHNLERAYNAPDAAAAIYQFLDDLSAQFLGVVTNIQIGSAIAVDEKKPPSG